MLSFIYRLCREFEQENGYRPNVLLINPDHYSRLRDDFGDLDDVIKMRRLLGLEILMRKDAVHPRVGWLSSAASKAG
jgi:hypothetical protein